MLGHPKNDPVYSQQRLDGIMGRRRLSFNPYSVSDRRLLEIAESTGWGNLPDITQIVILHFTRLREASDWRKFDGVYIRLGNSSEEIFLPTPALTRSITSRDTLRPLRTKLGKKSICNMDQVRALAGKRVFVSHILRGVVRPGVYSCAYRMHRLTGNLHRDATMIREAMCEAKIEMLERLLAYPESPDYLDCNRGLIDYKPRVRLAIELIRSYPDTPIPED